jgi:hypothetical protein
LRALLDESLPRRLARAFEGIEVETVFDRGWQGLKNGVLLGKAASEFDVFITADQNLRYQQNLAGFEIGVVVLAAISNRLDDLLPLLGAAAEACHQVRPGEVRVVSSQAPGPS